MKWLKIILAGLIFIAAPVYLAIKPLDFTPLVQVMFSIFLFLMAYWIGNSAELEKAARVANDRWLPQAESVILRLMTLQNNVKSFALSTNCNIEKSEVLLPELNSPELKAVKIKMKSDCEANAQRLTDIANQLEDAIADWKRFIEANCYEDECGRIYEALEQRELRLQKQIE